MDPNDDLSPGQHHPLQIGLAIVLAGRIIGAFQLQRVLHAREQDARFSECISTVSFILFLVFCFVLFFFFGICRMWCEVRL